MDNKQYRYFWLSGYLLLVSVPLIIQNKYVYHLLVMSCIYIVLAVSLNLLLGFTGLFSLGHAAFYGVGAYTSALLTLKAGLPFVLAFPLSGITAGLVGMMVGFPAQRLRGIFLAIGTLGFNEIFRLLLINWEWLTGGPAGLAGIPRPELWGFRLSQPFQYYLAAVVFMTVVLLITQRVLSSRPGRALKAIRDDEMAARAMGINITGYKVAVFGFSSLLAGLAGSFFAHYLSYVSPDNFTIHESFVLVAMVALGGMGNFIGSVFGALILVVLPETFRFLHEYRSLMYGATIILIMYFLPQGILAGRERCLWRWLKSGTSARDSAA